MDLILSELLSNYYINSEYIIPRFKMVFLSSKSYVNNIMETTVQNNFKNDFVTKI